MLLTILTFDTPPPIHFESGKGFRPFDVFVIPRLLPRSFRRRRWLFRFRSVKRFNFYSVGGERERGRARARLGFPAGIVVILIESTSNGKGEMGKWEGEGIFSLQET